MQRGPDAEKRTLAAQVHAHSRCHDAHRNRGGRLRSASVLVHMRTHSKLSAGDMQPRRTRERVALAGAIALFLFAKLLKYLGHVPITRSLFRTLNGSCLPAAAAAAACRTEAAQCVYSEYPCSTGPPACPPPPPPPPPPSRFISRMAAIAPSVRAFGSSYSFALQLPRGTVGVCAPVLDDPARVYDHLLRDVPPPPTQTRARRSAPKLRIARLPTVYVCAACRPWLGYALL